MKIDKVSILASIATVSTLLLFAAVYTPKILDYQAKGESAIDQSFEALHKASELDFKILLATLIILFLRRIYILATQR